MNKPLITIIVPIYKVPYNMLRNCLDSICAQTLLNFEALLIDDGSPDECGRICDEYVSQYSFMRVIHQENGGLSVVRNNGVNAAMGEWVCFVDGDDWIEPDTVEFAESYIQLCGGNSCDILIWDEYYNVGKIQKENCYIRDYEYGIKTYIREQKMELFDMFFSKIYAPFSNNYVDLGCAHARLYRKAFLKEKGICNIPGLKRMQDNVFNLWAIEKAGKICYQCKRLYHYRFNTEAATQKYSPNHANTMYFLYQCMENFIQENHNESDWYQRLYCRFIRVFGEMFKLNYANPDNHKPLKERLTEIRHDFERDKFREVVEHFDSSQQNRRIQYIHKSLQNKHYLRLLIYYSFSIRLRKYVLMMKRS